MTLAAGSRLGSYEIVSPLGAGGMGEVYRAPYTRLERTVAIKVPPARFAADADALARFEREARAVAALSHPNILAIHDFAARVKCAGQLYATGAVRKSCAGKGDRASVTGFSIYANISS